jgi:T5SS/PEP-CTERM-associated repeat protein
VTSNWSGDYVAGNTNFADALLIQNGGLLTDANGYLGNFTRGSNNSAFVSGSGSIWSNSSDLCVGNFGAGNGLVISGSGNVYNASASIGSNATATGNSVVVKDPGSIWRLVGNISIGLTVGYSGTGNSLVISNGGRVVEINNPIGAPPNNYIGFNPTSTNNNVTVTDAGSRWNGYRLRLGYSGAGNSLIVRNGGSVSSDFCWMGYNSSSGNNLALVSDFGSIWSNHGPQYVGYSGGGNSLVISNGGQLIDLPASDSDDYFVGYNLSSVNNGVLVTGAGSLWRAYANVYVGYSGAGSSLVISNGGQVINDDAYLGYNRLLSPSQDSVRVADGAVWQNNALYVGYLSSGNSLFVSGGSVLATDLVVGFGSGGCTNNLLQLDSGSVVVTNASHNAVLEVRDGTLILNGGTLQVDTILMTNACGLFVRNGGTLIFSNLVLDPNLSAVGDGIPNGWKQQHGLDPFDPNVANEDPDGDGMSNLQEYLAGTDPTNKASSFRITSIAQEGSSLRVTWMTGIGRTNALQAAGGGSYITNGFADIFTVTNTTGSLTDYLDVGGATNSPARFYRVRLVP